VDREFAGPITHVTPPASLALAALYSAESGLPEAATVEVRCGGGLGGGDGCEGCSLRDLAGVEAACGRAGGGEGEGVVSAVVVVVPPGSFVGAASAAAGAARALFPFVD
jgi:hypothetical protein